MRVALYARYSSELNNARSADDQLAALRLVAEARGWTVVAAYADRAISGASLANRPDFRTLMAQAERGAFDVVLAEAMDRISRDQEGTAHVFKRLTYYGVALETLSEGKVSELHVGLSGTMNQLFLVELGKKTRRGLVARVKAGFSGGGRCYGYRIIGKGELEPDPDQAQVVRRIFEAYASGKSAKTIAHRLNAEGVAGPRTGTWSPTTIIGDRRAQDGILCQELYIGVRLFNRRHYRKHPDTGRRSSVLNPPEQWIREAAPDLRIVSDELWAAVQGRLAVVTAAPKGSVRQPKRLLSGLLRCGLCAGAMTLHGGKYACGNHRDRGVCPNNKIIRAQTVEARVLDGIREHLLSPDAIAEAVTLWREGADSDRKAAIADRSAIDRELAELERRHQRATEAYLAGVMSLQDLAPALEPLKAKKAELEQRLAMAAAPPPAIALHPAAAGFYRQLAEGLHVALMDDEDGGEEVRTEVRKLIDRVDLYPRPGLGDFKLECSGQLARLLGFSEGRANCAESLGAGIGFEPMTFRL